MAKWWSAALGGLVVSAGLLLGAEATLRVVDGDRLGPPPSPIDFQNARMDTKRPAGPGAAQFEAGTTRITAEPAVGKRLVLLGGSAGLADGHQIWIAFAAHLERWLNLAYREPVEVINLAMGGIGSRQVRYMVNSLLRVDHPDLILIYSGNNEYHELRVLKELNPHFDTRAEWIRWRLANYHIYRHLRALLVPTTPPLIAPGGRDDPNLTTLRAPVTADDRRLVTDLYEANLAAIASATREAGVPLLLSAVADNGLLYERAGPGDPVDPAEDALLGAARRACQAAGPPCDGALAEALAGTSTYNGLIHLAREAVKVGGQDRIAQEAVASAEASDPQPFRSDREQRARVRAVAAREDAHLCDIAAQLAALSPHGIPGGEVFGDSCHPTPLGHWRIGALMARCILDQEILGPPDEADIRPALEAALAAPPPSDDWRLDQWQGKRLQRQRGRPEPATTAEGSALQGHQAFAGHDADQAIEAYTRALEQGGPRGPLLVSRALASLSARQLKAAQADLDQAIVELPEDPWIRDLRATLGP